MANEETQGRQQTVLLVDDEADILESLKDLIEASIDDVRVVAMTGARQALKHMQEQPVDLVVSDYKMPDMDGLEFLQEAYRLRPDTPRIMITAFPDLEVAINAINEARIENFFTKPLDPEQVIEVVEEALAGQRGKA